MKPLIDIRLNRLHKIDENCNLDTRKKLFCIDVFLMTRICSSLKKIIENFGHADYAAAAAV